MSENQEGDNRWKDNLLKSSLPLEQLVSEKLENKNLYIAGEYSYIKPNEQDINTEFSIDLHAYETIKNTYTTRLNLLIECKYNYPGIKWVFSPHVQTSYIPKFLYVLQNQEKYSLYQLRADLPICTRGIELNNSGFDPNTISRGLNQLRYGMPNLILQEALNIQKKRNPVKPHLSYICLILVTTANLYILKSNQGLDTYQSAKSLTEVAHEVKALIVAQELGPHLQKYCRSLLNASIKTLNKAPNRPEALDQMSDQYQDRLFPKMFQVIVVNLNGFDYIVNTLQNAIHTTSTSVANEET